MGGYSKSNMNKSWSSIADVVQIGSYHISLDLPDGSKLECQEVVRVIPGRRVVCRAKWQGCSVFAKIFIGKSAKNYALRDKHGVECLLAKHIMTPGLLYASGVNGSVYVLIFSAVELAENAEVAWQQEDEALRFELMQELVQTVVSHHRAGLVQSDLHLKNFLVARKDDQSRVIYTLDGDGIRHLSLLFQKRKKLRNLATLFSKMDVLDDRWIPELYQQYCSQLSIPYSLGNEVMVRVLTQNIRYKVAKGYAEKKVFRNCTDVKIAHSFERFLAVSSDFEVQSRVFESLDQFLSDAQRNIKNGNTCTIAKAMLANRSVIIKRYNIKNFWHGVNRVFRQSRAAISWENAHRLIILNIATPKPLALVEERLGWLRRRAYFLSEYVDVPDVMQFFAQSAKIEDRKIVARNLAALFCKLYLLRLSHGDCKATNIKIVDLAPVLIDLDSMQACRTSLVTDWWFKRRHIKDLKRLMKNWEHDVETFNLLKQALQLEYASQCINAGDNILIRAGIV